MNISDMYVARALEFFNIRWDDVYSIIADAGV